MRKILLALTLVMIASPMAFANTAKTANKYEEYDTTIDHSQDGLTVKEKLNYLILPKLSNFEDTLRRTRSISMALDKLYTQNDEQRILMLRNFLGLPPTLNAKETMQVVFDQWRHASKGSTIDVIKFESVVGRAVIDAGPY